MGARRPQSHSFSDRFVTVLQARAPPASGLNLQGDPRSLSDPLPDLVPAARILEGLGVDP